MARNYDADYDAFPTWKEYHDKLNSEGMTDPQIVTNLKGTKWDTPGSKYAEWAKPINDTLEARTPEAEQLLRKQLRKQYANDNEGYAKALKDNNIAVSNPSGKVRSIQEAYYDGGIDKSTRDYMMADAIAKFARNTGRDIGNIGAQFTGGTINNNYETPTWNDRNTELFKQKTSSEAAGIKGSDKNAQRRQQNANAYGTELSNTKNERVLGFSRNVKEMADDARTKGDANTALILDYLASSAAGGNFSYADLASVLAAGNASDVVPGSQNQGTQNQGTQNQGTQNPIDNPTANDQQEGLHLDTGVSNDIRKELTEYSQMSPTNQDKRIEDLYREAGGNADKYKLAALVESDQIDPNRVYIDPLIGPKVTGKDIISKVERWSQDSKFMDDYKHYTNMDLSNSEAINNIKKERAAQQFNEAVNYFTTNQKAINDYPTLRGFDPNNPTPKQIELLRRIAANRKSWNSTEADYAKAYLQKMGL